MSAPVQDEARKCLSLLFHGTRQRKRSVEETAARAFAAAMVITQALPAAEGGSDLRSLALYNLSLLVQRRGHKAEAAKMREQAAELLSSTADAANLPPDLAPLFLELMADALFEAGEHRRAIPYCEAAVQHFVSFEDPVALGEVLWRVGKCYARMGLRDHAVVPLRAAAKIFRGLTADPRFPAILLDLGNALRKNFPKEAEEFYSEAAELHVSRGQLQSAAPAWVNLGVLCSEQGRYAESLAHYERALRVREQSPGTPPERIGTLLNNVANVHRRVSQFEEANRHVDRAIPFLESTGGHPLACAFGTRGLIFRDQGRDQEAVDWFRKSSIEHRKLSSPNLETLSEELENEAAALERLGRTGEAKIAHDHLTSVRAAMAEVQTAERELGDMKPSAEGAVLVELDFGSRDRRRLGSDPARIADRLGEVLKSTGIGHLGGRVIIPETTTLIFYGPNAESVFEVVHPLLLEESICRGARITIRQADRHREVILPAPLM